VKTAKEECLLRLDEDGGVLVLGDELEVELIRPGNSGGSWDPRSQ
jgi:hypothetical protein